MSEKQKYWLVDEAGVYARVEGAAQRDRWVPMGHAEADEPIGASMVWAWHEGIETPARFPAEALAVWEAKGWEAGPPPEPLSPFNSDQPVTAVAPLTGAPAPAPAEPTTKTAAGGDKEKNRA
jgi:hypothetical protein